MVKPLPPPEMSDEEMAWRTGWAFAYSGAANLLGGTVLGYQKRPSYIEYSSESGCA